MDVIERAGFNTIKYNINPVVLEPHYCLGFDVVDLMSIDVVSERLMFATDKITTDQVIIKEMMDLMNNACFDTNTSKNHYLFISQTKIIQN